MSQYRVKFRSGMVMDDWRTGQASRSYIHTDSGLLSIPGSAPTDDSRALLLLPIVATDAEVLLEFIYLAQTGGSIVNGLAAVVRAQPHALSDGTVGVSGGPWQGFANLGVAHYTPTFASLATNSSVVTWTAGVKYRMRFRVTGSTAQVKVWAASASEPGTWRATATTSVLTAGRIGFGATGTATSQIITQVAIGTGGDSASFTAGEYVSDIEAATVEGTVLAGDPPEPARRKIFLIGDDRVVGTADSDEDGDYSAKVFARSPIYGIAVPDYGDPPERSTAYVLGDRCWVGGPTPAGHWYECEQAGTTHSSAPIWPTDGGTVTDGTVVWRDMGAMERPWAEGPFIADSGDFDFTIGQAGGEYPSGLLRLREDGRIEALPGGSGAIPSGVLRLTTTP